MKSKAAQALAAILAIIALSAMCYGGALPFAGTVGTPKDRVEAVGTATAIAPAIVPTVRFNEHVLPTQQAEEANQIVETTRRKYENARARSDFAAKCWKGIVGGLTIFVAIAQASGAGALVGAVVCYIVERIKRARAYEPIQVLPDSALYYPRYQMLADTRTGLTWEITTYRPACINQGTILVDRMTGPGARFQLRNGERHSKTILDAVKLPSPVS